MNFSHGKRAAAQWLGTFALLFAAASVVLRPAVAAKGVLRGLGLCYETVIPALFPFMVLSRLLLESPAAEWFGLLLWPYTRLLGLRGKKAPAALLCGLLGGFACGAQAVDTLYREGGIDRNEAARLLVCTIGSGPGFIIGGVGALMLGRAGAGRLLLAAQVGASLLCGGIAAGAAAAMRRQDGARRNGMHRAAVACSGAAAVSDVEAASAAVGPSVVSGAAAASAAHSAVLSGAAAASAAHSAVLSGAAATSTAHSAILSGVAAAALTDAPGAASPIAMSESPFRRAGISPHQMASPRFAQDRAREKNPAPYEKKSAEPPQTGFVPAVRGAVTATVTLCGYVTLFSFFAAILVPSGAPALLRYCAMLPLEVTSACRAACETAGAWRSELCCAALSVMGASVFFQVRALTSPEISLRPLLFSRLAHLPLALMLFRTLARLFPHALTAGAQLDAAILPAVRMPPDVMAVLFVLSALACGALRPRARAGS